MIETSLGTIETMSPLLSLEYFIDTAIDQAVAARDIDRFLEGETVQSGYGVPIARVGYDISRFAEDLRHLRYSRYTQSATLTTAVGKNGKLISDTDQIAFNAELEILHDRQKQELGELMKTFTGVVATDRKRHGLGYSGGSHDNVIVVRAALGYYDKPGIVVHTDPSHYGGPEVKYLGSFGVAGTGTISGDVRFNSDRGYRKNMSDNEVKEAGAKQEPQGIVQRIVMDRDKHFAPTEHGYRIFLSSVIGLYP